MNLSLLLLVFNGFRYSREWRSARIRSWRDCTCLGCWTGSLFFASQAPERSEIQLWISPNAMDIRGNKDVENSMNLVAGFQCVLQLQSDVVTLHVGVKIFLIDSGLKFCWFSQSVQHLDENKQQLFCLMSQTELLIAFPNQWTITNTFCFSFSVQICLFFSTKLKRASCSLVNPISFFFSCKNTFLLKMCPSHVLLNTTSILVCLIKPLWIREPQV